MDANVEQKNELVVIVDQLGLEPETSKSLQEVFLPFYQQALEWKTKSESLVVTDVTQVREMKMAREARLAMKDIRVNVEKRRKELKEDSLRKGKAIDSVANLLKGLIEPIEEHLEKQEKFAEAKEAQRKEEQKKLRGTLLEPFGVQTEFYDLANMPEDSFQQLLTNSRKNYEDRIAAEKKAEEERIAKEQEELKERERIRLENEELKRKQEEQEKELREERMKAEQQRKEAEERERKQREESEAKLLEEKQKAEAEQKLQREEQEKKLAAERAEREKVEAELKAKQEAEEKAKRDAEAVAEAELSKGDKQKFQDLINELESVKSKYSFKSKKYKVLFATVVEHVNKTINWAISKQ